MSFSKTLENILKNNGKGPEVKDEILSKHITVQDWDSSISYQPGEICRGGGDVLYYSKVASTNQNPALDTSETYWAKLADYDGVVHKTGEETISGLKKFTDNLMVSGITEYVTTLGLGTPLISMGEDPDSQIELRLVTYDNVTTTQGHRFGAYRTAINPNGSVSSSIEAYQNIASAGDQEHAAIYVGVLKNGEKYAIAPSTSSTRTNGLDILTRDWIPKDTRIVHTTGGEEISGGKTFNNNVTISNDAPYLYVRQTDVEKGVESGQAYSGIYFRDKNDSPYGAVISRFYGGLNGAVEIIGYDVTSQSATGSINVRVMYHSVGKIMEPDSNGDVLLGRSSHRWREIWCTQSSINSSSDERIKTQIDQIPDNVLDAWGSIDWLQYKFVESEQEKGSNARYHTGTTAQMVDRAFRNSGLDASKYGLFLYDEWDETPEEKDEAGRIIHEYQPAGNSYGLRYTEALCMEAAYQRRRASRAESRIANLEEEVSSLKSQISQLLNR